MDRAIMSLERIALHRGKGRGRPPAWMAGSATMYDHIPTPPMVESSTATPRRSHAVGESISDGALAPIGEIIVLVNPGYIRPLVALSRGRDYPSFEGAISLRVRLAVRAQSIGQCGIILNEPKKSSFIPIALLRSSTGNWTTNT